MSINKIFHSLITYFPSIYYSLNVYGSGVCVCFNPSTAVHFSSPNALKLWLFFIRLPNALSVFFSWQPEQNKPSLKAAQIILLINNVFGALESCIIYLFLCCYYWEGSSVGKFHWIPLFFFFFNSAYGSVCLLVLSFPLFKQWINFTKSMPSLSI